MVKGDSAADNKPDEDPVRRWDVALGVVLGEGGILVDIAAVLTDSLLLLLLFG